MFLLVVSVWELIKLFFKYIWWNLTGRQVYTYRGFHCGCCGRWTNTNFVVRKYDSEGEWIDTWGLCKRCAEDDDEEE